MSKGFDTVFKQFKDNTKPMCELIGCPELVDDFIADVEINRQSFKSFYEAGQQSKQAEVDELNFQLAEMKSRLNEAYTDGQSSMYKTKQAEIDELKKELEILQGMYNAVSLVAGDLVEERDELQNRIDESLVKIFEWYDQTYRDDAHQLIGELEGILKGNTNE